MVKSLHQLKTLVQKNVFTPTGTSDLLIVSSSKFIRKKKLIW